jgi:hypothetical protein
VCGRHDFTKRFRDHTDKTPTAEMWPGLVFGSQATPSWRFRRRISYIAASPKNHIAYLRRR